MHIHYKVLLVGVQLQSRIIIDKHSVPQSRLRAVYQIVSGWIGFRTIELELGSRMNSLPVLGKVVAQSMTIQSSTIFSCNQG